MSQRRPYRFVALLALTLTLLAALPCSLLASEDSCCGAQASCADASESPCAQLAPAACCEAGGAPLDASPAPRLPAPAGLTADLALAAPVLVETALRHAAPPVPTRDAISLRRIVLRL
jgi:hypothetical protein